MTQPLRVLHVIERMDRGGAEALLMNLYRAIDRDVIQFDFMVHTTEKAQYDDEIRALGGRIFRVNRFYGYNPYSYRRAWNKFFTEHLEHGMVHGHIASSAPIYLGVAQKFGRTTIAHAHSDTNGPGLLGFALGVVNRFTPRVTDYFFACSAQAARHRFGASVTDQPNYYFVPNGIDTAEYAYSPRARERVREEFELGGTPVVGHVGRFDPQKNHMFLIDVWRRILDNIPDARFLLVGDGPLRGKVENKIAEAGLNDRVILTGVRTDVPDLLSAMDVFCFPSIHEGLGIVVLEAQASGLPSVITDTIPPEVDVTDQVTRLALNQGTQVWADMVANLLASPAVRDAVSAKQVADAGFDVNQVASWLTDFYLTHNFERRGQTPGQSSPM